jgi:hypothetical protein
MTVLNPDDASYARAASRVVSMVAQELDMLAFLAQQGKDEAMDWLLTRSVKPRIDTLLKDYRINIVFGLMTKKDAVTGLANYLRLQPWTDGASTVRHIRMWDMRGSHVVYELYEGTVVKIKMRDAARIMLRHFDPVPRDARCLLMRAIVQRQTKLVRSVTDEALMYRTSIEARAVVNAALLVYQSVTKRNA